MSGWDEVFLVLAAADLIIVAGIGWIVSQLAKQGKASSRLVTPSVGHVQRTAAHAKALAGAGQRAGRNLGGELKSLAQRVQARTETVRHLVSELRPPVDGQEARAMVQSARVRAARGKEWAGRLRRLHRAAKAACSHSDKE